MSRLSVDHLVSCHAEVGEGPLYDPDTGMLHWVDIPRGSLWRCAVDGGAPEVRSVGRPVGCLAQVEGGGFLVGARDGVLVLADWHADPVLWRPIEPDRPTQLNDGRCDARGRFLVGTAVADRSCDGALYRVDHDGSVHALLDGIGMSNGLGWSPDDRFLYYVDSLAQTVTRYDWDADAGVPRNPVVFVTVPQGDGLPDGLAVDDDGCLWLAVWGAGQVRRYEPRGRWIDTVELPTPNVTSCAFGGRDGRDLFVTTAAVGTATTDTVAGDVFVTRASTTGRSPARFPRHALPSATAGGQ